MIETRTNSLFRTGLLWFVMTTAMGLLLDLWTKHLSVQLFSTPAAAYDFIPGYLQFTAVQNRGAVFGLGQGWRWVFVLVSVGAIGFVGYMFSRSPRHWWYDVTLGMLLAGVLGNLYDRIFIGYVRDMIHALPRWPNAFPWVFNVADSLLCVSIAILLIVSFFLPQEAGAEATPDDAPAN